MPTTPGVLPNAFFRPISTWNCKSPDDVRDVESSFLGDRTPLAYTATGLLGVGIITGLIAKAKQASGALFLGVILGLAGIAGFIWNFAKGFGLTALLPAASAPNNSGASSASDSQAPNPGVPDLSKASIDELRQALADGERPVRNEAVNQLTSGRFEASQTVPLLRGAISDRIPGVKISAVKGLAKLGPEAKDAVPELRGALSDRHLCEHAAVALGKIGPDAIAALPDLRTVLTSDSSNDLDRIAAEAAIRKIEGEAKAAVPELIKLLSDPEVNVRNNAAVALGNIGPEAKAAIEALRALSTTDPNDDVKQVALEALAKIEGNATEQTNVETTQGLVSGGAVDLDQTASSSDAAELPKPTIDDLQVAFLADDIKYAERVRRSEVLVEAIENDLDTANVINFFVTNTRSENPEIAAASAWALRRFDTEAAFNALTHIVLNGNNYLVLRSAVSALQAAGDVNAIDSLGILAKLLESAEACIIKFTGKTNEPVDNATNIKYARALNGLVTSAIENLTSQTIQIEEPLGTGGGEVLFDATAVQPADDELTVSGGVRILDPGPDTVAFPEPASASGPVMTGDDSTAGGSGNDSSSLDLISFPKELSSPTKPA